MLENRIPVSICIPAFEDAECLARLLESIEKQTAQPHEIVVSDNSSSGQIERLCKSDRFNRLPIIYKKFFGNSTANWNNAITLSSAEIKMLIHHDDWFLTPETLQFMFERMLSETCALVCASSVCVNNKTNEFSNWNIVSTKKLAKLNSNFRSLLSKNIVGAPSVVMFRGRNVLFDEKLKWLVDVDFYFRKLIDGKLISCDKALIGIGIGEAQITSRLKERGDTKLKELFYVLDKHGFSCLTINEILYLSRLNADGLCISNFNRLEGFNKVKVSIISALLRFYRLIKKNVLFQ